MNLPPSPPSRTQTGHYDRSESLSCVHHRALGLPRNLCCSFAGVGEPQLFSQTSLDLVPDYQVVSSWGQTLFYCRWVGSARDFKCCPTLLHSEGWGDKAESRRGTADGSWPDSNLASVVLSAES